MAENKKISELTQTTTITGEELVPIVIDGQNKVVKTQYLRGATNLGEDFVDIVGDDGKKYRVKIVNGEAIAKPIEVFEAEPVVEGDNQRFRGLIINQMYGGGNDVAETPVSHSFIELYNLTEEDMNLKGIYLFYRAKAGTWQSLALEGIIKARHSFLIRCARHNAFFKQSVRCNILDYDMSWDVKLSDKGFSCYLAIGDATPEDNPQRQTKDAQGNVDWTNPRYIDLLGCGGTTSNDTIWAYETRFLYCMDRNTAVRRIDFSNACTDIMKVAGLGSNASNKGFNDIDCEPINYKTCNVDFYRPRCTKDGRWTEFVDKPRQKESVPSMINVMFGENGNSTRTFTFQTPLVDTNGFVKIRKVGEVKWNTYETSIEIADNVEADTTVHRCIVHDLEPGEYEYMVGIEGCTSDAYSMEIKEFNSSNPMRILWTSDQQAWTKKEYDVWRVAASWLNKKANQFDWHLNTGDISQNANRRFEWNYYYDYAQDITRNMPHVVSCGNNDLIGKNYSDAYNYYLTPENPFANSVFAFDLGFTHFVCLNSNQDRTYIEGEGSQGGYSTTDEFLEAQAQWLDQHLTEVEQRAEKPRWVIVFAHLSPFTVSRVERLQRWIAPCEKHKVDMFLCGHNHAWSVSKALYTGYNYNQNPVYNDYVKTQSGSTELLIVDEFKADGQTPVNREEDKANGTYYVLNQACGFKLSGKEKPMTLKQLAGTEHVNEDNSPWWLSAQSLPKNPVYIDLQISYDTIICDSYEILGIKGADEFKNETINFDMSKVSENKFHTLIINYSDRNK